MEKIIVITGDSSGIGKCLCDILCKDNIVYGISRREIETSYKHYSCDVLDEKKVKKIIDEIYEIHKRIDMVICCAGLGVAGATECMSTDDINYQLDVNINGVVNVDKAVIPYMRENKAGRIVHVSSLAAIAPMPFQSFYSASKACINNYSMALSNELKPFGIKVITIMPGDIKSGFTAARRKIQDENNYYNGQVERSIQKMASDEDNGQSPEYAASVINKIIMKKNPRVLYTIGFGYNILAFLLRTLPVNFVNKVLYKMYAK